MPEIESRYSWGISCMWGISSEITPKHEWFVHFEGGSLIKPPIWCDPGWDCNNMPTLTFDILYSRVPPLPWIHLLENLVFPAWCHVCLVSGVSIFANNQTLNQCSMFIPKLLRVWPWYNGPFWVDFIIMVIHKSPPKRGVTYRWKLLIKLGRGS